MSTQVQLWSRDNPIFDGLRHIPGYFARPVHLFQRYNWRDELRPDMIAGLTVAVILLPQGIAYALIAELPAQVGLYTAIVGAIIGALWGSSNHLQTGPTNAASLLVLSVLLPLAEPGSMDFVMAAGLMAVMVGIFRLVLGLARLGMLVNFVSDSVIVGFTAGAGLLISVNQLRPLLRLDLPSSPGLVETAQNIALHLPETHWPSLVLGVGTMVIIILIQRFAPKLPGPLIGMVTVSVVVGLLRLDQQGVSVIGQLPRSLPPLAALPLLDLRLIGELSTGALAVGIIGLVEAMSIARSIAGQTGQRLDSNQEFVGQGLANIATGFFSGYTGSGSFTRSAVNYKSGGQTPMSSLFSGLFVLVAMLVLAPLAAYVPRTALAGVLILTAYGMVDYKEMARIWRGTRGDTIIMTATLLATLFFPLQFAVLTGVLFSLARYIIKSSMPAVYPVLPDASFEHFVEQHERNEPCPQLGIINISGDLFFGAVNHVEESIVKHLAQHPQQRFVLLRMHGVNQCDFSGIHMLETVLRMCRERGGDLFFVRVQDAIYNLMRLTGFIQQVGVDHFLSEDEAISYLFHKIIDPAICIYECPNRAFKECQNLPKRTYDEEIEATLDEIPPGDVPTVSPQALWQELFNKEPPPLVVDVREAREFRQGHIPQARLMPLPEILADGEEELPPEREIVLVCRGGRRSTRTTHILRSRGYDRVRVLAGGMVAWEAANMLEAIDDMTVPSAEEQEVPQFVGHVGE